MRLIDADAITLNPDLPYKASVRRVLAQAKTVDAVPVIRCRDCKHFGGHGACHCHASDQNGTPIFVREFDFCSYGERRTEG